MPSQLKRMALLPSRSTAIAAPDQQNVRRPLHHGAHAAAEGGGVQADALRAERCHAFKIERSDRGAQGREAPRYGRADALRLSAPAKGRCPEWARAAQ